jgi:hypothetical protein
MYWPRKEKEKKKDCGNNILAHLFSLSIRKLSQEVGASRSRSYACNVLIIIDWHAIPRALASQLMIGRSRFLFFSFSLPASTNICELVRRQRKEITEKCVHAYTFFLFP